MVRLSTPRDTPLAVQQWDSLIAVNYPARSHGITRMISAKEAKRLCPGIVLQHVATFREGEGGAWAYRRDSFKHMGSEKVSLDPYRAESRRILNAMKMELGKWFDGLSCVDGVNGGGQISPAVLEKASVDEVYIDLSPLVYAVLLQRYPELREVPNGEDDKVAMLPRPPTTALEWNPEDCLVDLDENETEIDNPDWDDIIMLTGSEIVRAVRNAVWENLHYTCSAGIARNKMMAKLGSSSNKPNKQTVVRNRAVQNFLGGFKFTKIRMLGGKLGDKVTSFFGTEQVSDLLNVPFEQFRAKLDDDTAAWLYGIIRGEDRSEVNPRTQIKSMASAKSFRPSINSAEQAEKWLCIFAADISNRLAEDGVLENRRRPKTIALHHRQGAQVRSKQIPIPASKSIDESILFDLGNVLLRQVMADGNVWPCSNLSLSVGGFEDGVTKNRAIDGFLVRGAEAQAKNNHSVADDLLPQSEKRRKLDDNGIKRFFTRPSTSVESEAQNSTSDNPTPKSMPFQSTENPDSQNFISNFTPTETPEGSYLCPRCNKTYPEIEKPEHDDWHFAKDLEDQDREAAMSSPQQAPRQSTGPSSRGRGGRNGKGKTEKGQMRLRFG
ncbi:Sister chromatid cohesion protein [Aspergillus sclerotialis]|uniref:DNA polymerase eta n=1 Tax=Aspergillus sclerotialis TaxID=2070753 RepID=A0A3A2Z952_9EURO|nr:Sister chromatid cohesion protein [Aspergillus sclerotialis]